MDTSTWKPKDNQLRNHQQIHDQMNQILGGVMPVPSVLAPIPEESDSMNTTIPEIVEPGPEIPPRQPESAPGSEPADRNVRPHLAPNQKVTQQDEVESSQSTTANASRSRPDTRRSSCGKSVWSCIFNTSFVANGVRQQLFDSSSC